MRSDSLFVDTLGLLLAVNINTASAGSQCEVVLGGKMFGTEYLPIDTEYAGEWAQRMQPRLK